MELAAGPRGRRLLLAFAKASGRTVPGQGVELGIAVSEASFRLAQKSGYGMTRFGWGEPPRRSEHTATDVAGLLAEVQLVPATQDVLLEALTESVDSAMYWQEPDGEDLLCRTPQVQAGLVRVAEHLGGSPAVQAWAAPADPADQWLLAWDAAQPPSPRPDLSQWRADILVQELTARRDRPVDPRANWSGDWWSHPPGGLPTSTSSLPDGSPVGLWLVEDSLGWQDATAHRLEVDPSSRIYEIDGGGAWATLCREFALEVTALKRHDWYRATGHVGPWVIPDWSLVARHYDGVHLTIAGYLAAATSVIDVDDAASVIAGWAPDTTWWLNDIVRPGGERARWRNTIDDPGGER